LSGAAGYAATFAVDAKDGIVVVGSTFDLWIRNAIDVKFAGGLQSGLQRYDPISRKLSNFAPGAGSEGYQLANDDFGRALYCWTFKRLIRYDGISAGWIDVTSALPPEIASINFIQPSGNLVYMAAGLYGVGPLRNYVSLDRGEHWTARSDDQIGAIDPFEPCRLVGSQSDRVSTDCGQSWRILHVQANPIGSSQADPRNRNVLFAFYRADSTSTGVVLRISKDWGESWEDTSFRSSGAILIFDPRNPAGLFAIDTQAIWQSSDFGATWSQRGVPATIIPTALRSVRSLYASGCIVLSQFPDGGFDNYVTCDGFQSVNLIPGRSIAPATGLSDGSVLFSRYTSPAQFLAKFTYSGDQIWSTYISGSDPVTLRGLQIAPNGEIVVNGWTDAPDFPTTTSIGSDQHSFVMRVSADGKQLLSCTRLPGSADAALGPDGAIWVAAIGTGYKTPVTDATTGNMYVLKLTPDGSRVLYGGYSVSGGELQGISVGPGDAFYATSANRNDVTGRFYGVAGGDLTTFDRTSGKSTSIPLGALYAGKIQLLPGGDLLIAGANGSHSSISVREGFSSPGAFQPLPSLYNGVSSRPYKSQLYQDGYLLRLKPDGSLRFGTYLGGISDDWITGAYYGKYGQVTVVGNTGSVDFPSKGLVETRQSAPSGFLAKFDAGFTSLTYSTYLNNFSPVAVFGHPDGGSLVVGTGQSAPNGRDEDGVVFIRVKESPGQLPRIDSVLPAADGHLSEIKAGDVLAVKGEGFVAGARGVLGGVVLDTAIVSSTELRVTVPAGTPFGSAEIVVEAGGARSQAVWLTVGDKSLSYVLSVAGGRAKQ